MSNIYSRQSQQQEKQQQEKQQQYNNTTFQRTGFKSKPAAAMYVQNASDFPELSPLQKETPVKSKTINYANVVASKPDKKELCDEYIIPDGWTQISIDRKTGKKEVKVSNATLINEGLVKEETVGELIVKELETKWDKYKAEYDSIHGEGAYKDAHYSEPVYPFLDEEYNSESDHSDYSGEMEGELLDRKM